MDKEKKKQRLSSIIVDGGKYMTTLSEKYKNRKPYEENDPKKVKAFIPGIIAEIMTKPGKNVKEGDVLLILEAMKMRNNVVAPCDGKVSKVLVSLGQLVSKGVLIVEME